MAETNADDLAAITSDEEFEQQLSEAAANESVDDSVNLDEEEEETTEEETTEEETAEETTETEEETEEETTEEEFEEGHDPYKNLEEEGDDATEEKKETTEEKSKEVPQFKKDASNIAKTWNDLDDADKSEKIEKLAKNRPGTLDALAEELGTTAKQLTTEFTDVETAKQDIDVEAITKKAKEEALAELRSEMAPELKQAETNRFNTTVDGFAKTNKLTSEQTTALKSLEGDVYKTFTETTHNPKGGQEMSFNERMKYALKSEGVTQMLIDRGAIAKAKKIAAGAQAALPKVGKKAKSSATSAADLANADDSTFAKGMKDTGSRGVAPIEFE